MSEASDKLEPGDRIKILAGTFEDFEAVVTSVDEAAGKVSAEIWIFGKATPVEVQRNEVTRAPRRSD
jgi:transcription antitermination factor NusG